MSTVKKCQLKAITKEFLKELPPKIELLEVAIDLPDGNLGVLNLRVAKGILMHVLPWDGYNKETLKVLAAYIRDNNIPSRISDTGYLKIALRNNLYNKPFFIIASDSKLSGRKFEHSVPIGLGYWYYSNTPLTKVLMEKDVPYLVQVGERNPVVNTMEYFTESNFDDNPCTSLLKNVMVSMIMHLDEYGDYDILIDQSPLSMLVGDELDKMLKHFGSDLEEQLASSIHHLTEERIDYNAIPAYLRYLMDKLDLFGTSVTDLGVIYNLVTFGGRDVPYSYCAGELKVMDFFPNILKEVEEQTGETSAYTGLARGEIMNVHAMARKLKCLGLDNDPLFKAFVAEMKTATPEQK